MFDQSLLQPSDGKYCSATAPLVFIFISFFKYIYIFVFVYVFVFSYFNFLYLFMFLLKMVPPSRGLIFEFNTLATFSRRSEFADILKGRPNATIEKYVQWRIDLALFVENFIFQEELHLCALQQGLVLTESELSQNCNCLQNVAHVCIHLQKTRKKFSKISHIRLFIVSDLVYLNGL